jgi:hypothetical protein
MDLDEAVVRKLTGWEGELVLLQDWPDLVGLEDALVLLDELNLWMPSRVWARMPGQLLWKWAQVRKHGLDIWYTSQHIKRVDKVVRELTFSSCQMSSYVMLGFFLAKWYIGTGEQYQCMEFVPFRRRVCKAFDTRGLVRAASFVQGSGGLYVPSKETVEPAREVGVETGRVADGG